MINLNDLIVFLAAAEVSNFSEAGRQIHLSQPAVSQKIGNLEKHFGSQLFVREGRSVKLTEAGQALCPMARELISNARRLEESMISLQGEVVGEINLGCSTASGKYLLPGIIARFRKNFPQVRVNILVSSRESLMRKLLSGEIAIGVSSKKIDHREIEYQDFFTDNVILIADSRHAWAQYRHIYPDDLLDEPIILREEAAGTHEVLMDGLEQHDISPDMLNIAMTLGNAEAIVMAVGEGLGVAFVSRLSAKRDLELGRVMEIDVDGLRLSRQIFLARNRRIPASRSQTELWDFVMQMRGIKQMRETA